MAQSRIDVALTPTGVGSRIALDGVDISHKVSGVKIESVVGELTTVILTLINVEVNIVDGVASVEQVS